MFCHLRGKKMIKLYYNQRIIRQLFGGFLFLSLSLGVSHAAEDEYFEQKDQSFWVLKNKNAFLEAAKTLIDDKGEWKGNPPVPEYIKYCEPLTEEELPLLEKWLSLKGLQCFGKIGRAHV